MNVMPMGGKSPGSTLVGMSVDAGGKPITKKAWENEVIAAYTMSELPSTIDTIRPNALDVSDCGAISLRIENTSDAEYTLGFYTDTHPSTKQTIKNLDGNSIYITIPANKYFIAVTPDDMPILSWLANARIWIKPSTIPTEGTLNVWIVKKK